MLKQKMKFSLLGALALFSLAATPAVASAADFELETVFEDSLYGGAIGALIGGGAMLISSQPSKHWDYVVTGAGVGIIAGAVYGLYTSTRSFAQLEDGKMTIGVPTPKISLRQYEESTDLALEADLLRVNY